MAPRTNEIWIYLVLFVLVVALYFQVRDFSFITYDDPDYVGTSQVRGGITKESLRWALFSGEASNWFPVTRLSHLLDGQLFGAQSGFHHLTNVLFHALATLFLFAFLYRATGARWRSGLVALVFAIHPLHVESVAWVAERKDVLSALFWFLTLFAYVRYAERPRVSRYLLVLFLFCLGLMSKPMVVTLPFVLLLVDVWPLRRVTLPGTSIPEAKQEIVPIHWRRALQEKVPFLVLSACGATIAFITQKTGGAVGELWEVSLGTRFENALISYATYIVKTIVPTDLAVLYPYPTSIPVWQAILAGLAIAGASTLILRGFRTHSYLTAGWLWYLGTLIPVIGLVQVGSQARADRYMYIPMVGLSIMVAWGAAEVIERWPGTKLAVQSCLLASCACFIGITWVQLRYWQNSDSLYRHAIEVTGPNELMYHNLYALHHNLGVELSKVPGRELETVAELEAALKIKPKDNESHYLLGKALAKIPGRLSEGLAEYDMVIRSDPRNVDALTNRGLALMKIAGRQPDAISDFKTVVRLRPDSVIDRINLAVALSQFAGHSQEAIAELKEAVRIDPKSAQAHYSLALLLSRDANTLSESVSESEAALKIEPENAIAHMNLGIALAKIKGREMDAVSEFETAERLNPGLADAHLNAGTALYRMPGHLQEAISEFKAALQARPNDPVAHFSLGLALSRVPDIDEARSEIQEAIRLEPDPANRESMRELLTKLKPADRASRSSSASGKS